MRRGTCQAGKVANQIDPVIADASELFGVPKDHRHMEEARHMVLKAGMQKFSANGGNQMEPDGTMV
jgi:hypothetical protein